MDLLQALNALLLSNPTNIRYLTGFVSAAPQAREAYFCITRDQMFLFTNSLYMEQAKKLKTNLKLEILEISPDKPFSKQLASLCTKLSIQTVGFEETDLTVSEFERLRKEMTKTMLVPTQGRAEAQRMIKKNDEINFIKQAAKLTDQCFDDIVDKLKLGSTEADIAWDIESFIRTRGGTLAFSPIVAFNGHASQPHYQTMDHEPLRMNSLILLDFGARVNGYCADMTRVVFLGKPKDEWTRAYNTVLQAQLAALDLLASGERNGAKLDQAARDVLTKAGYSVYPHSLGHALGLDIHESPRLTIKKDAQLLPGMVFTIEPGIYVEGQYGIRIEDLVCLNKDGIEILSTSTKKLLTL